MAGSQESGSRWGRYAAEVATIVVGILLAIVANAGYKYLTDRATEKEILTALRVEFAADVRELTRDQEDRANKLANIDLVAAVRSGAIARPAPDSMARALLRLVGYRFYTASHPVLDDLVVTGRLDLIRSGELRLALMKFGAERARIAVVELRERDFVATQFEPYLVGRVDLGALASNDPAETATIAEAIDEVLGETGFGSLLYLDRDRTQSNVHFADGFLATVYEVQRILGKED